MPFTPTLQNWDALLQDDYVTTGVVSAINNATPFRDKLKRVGATHGRQRVYAVKIGASQGQGARGENETMPPAGAGEYDNAKVTAKYNYAPFRISGPAEEFGTRKAFAEFGTQIVEDNKEGLRLFTGRQCWGDGQGTLCLVNNGGGYAAGISTITVDSAYGVLWGSLAGNTTFLVKRNMSVQFGAEDNGGQGYTVRQVSATSFQITPALQNAIADNATVSILKSANKEIEGWLKMVATAAFQTALGLGTTVYHDIDRAAVPEWEGNVVNAGAALSLPLIRALRNAIYARTDDEESNLCMTSLEVTRDYEALLQPGQRFVPASVADGGMPLLEHDGLRWSKDSKAPVKSLNLADTKSIAWMQTRDPHWLQDGSGITRVVQGADAKEALLRWYSNLDPSQPRRLGMLYNLTVS